MKIANFIKLLMLCLVLYGCNQKNEEEIIMTSFDRYDFLVHKYNIQDYLHTKSADYNKYDYLHPIETVEQLENILKCLEQFFIFESHPVEDGLDIGDLGLPALKSMSESQSVVVISDIQDEGRTDVHLDIITPSVITSAFYPSGLITPLFTGYDHLSGGVSVSGSRIDFTVNGEMIFKITWEEFDIKRTPVVIRGYYDKLLQSGEITN